jgi:hypothetical protein
MIKERLNPLNDYIFLKIIGEKGDEEQLCAFLNAVLGRKGPDAIMSIEIIVSYPRRHLPGSNINGRAGDTLYRHDKVPAA